MHKTLFLPIILTIFPVVLGGFIEGEPCHHRNTALLNPTRPVWPRFHVHCVDMRNMGNTSWMVYINQIKNTTAIFADSMLLKRVPIKAVSALPKLELLDVSNNSIRRLKPDMFWRNSKFTTLLLAKNRVLLPLNKPFLVSKSMKSLYLSKNYIKNIPAIAFTGLPSLMVLFLDSNELTYLDPSAFHKLHSLKMLHLGNNLLTQIPPKYMISKNLVTYITKGNPRRTRMRRKFNRKPIK